MFFQKNLRLVSVLLATLTMLGASYTLARTARAQAKGNPVAGKTIFTSKCIVCHKADGSGGVKLTGNPTPNWKDPKTWADPKRKTGDVYLRECITNGKAPSGMVAWGKTGLLKPAQVEDAIAYINTLAKRK
jgi:mono/diheme cytochrome c family protein